MKGMIFSDDMLREAMGGAKERPKPTEPMHEALMETFAELCARYPHGLPETPGLPFRRGDVVQFRKGYAHAQVAERPAVVVEVRALPLELERDAESGFGRRLDTRIVVFDSDHDMVPCWTESWTLERR